MVLADPGLIGARGNGPLWNCPHVVLGMVQADRAISIAFDGLYRSGFRDLVDVDVMAAMVIAAIDQHIVDFGFARLAEGDLLLIGRHGLRFVVNRPTLRPPAS